MILSILKFPDRRIRVKATRVTWPLSDFDRTLADDLLETLLAGSTQRAHGVAIGATQVGAPRSVIAVDAKKCGFGDECMVMFNAEMIQQSDSCEIDDEGCLSLPGVFAPVRRHKEIVVSYCDEDGDAHSIALEGFAARVLQHELDHLAGRVILDALPKESVAAAKAALWRKKHK